MENQETTTIKTDIIHNDRLTCACRGDTVILSYLPSYKVLL
jgi:hypothetical protein